MKLLVRDDHFRLQLQQISVTRRWSRLRPAAFAKTMKARGILLGCANEFAAYPKQRAPALPEQPSKKTAQERPIPSKATSNPCLSTPGLTCDGLLPRAGSA
jgi:hypothetical protein